MAIRVSNITVIDDSRNIVNVDNIGIGTTGSSGTLQIGAGTSAVVVTGVGSVGIGTTNPTAPLHISGADAANAKIKLEDNNNGFAASEINVTNGGRDLRIAAPQDIYFEDLDTNTKTLYIKDGGNVGIGTDDPGAKLNVVDNSSSDALRITQLGSGNALVVEDSTNPDATPFVVNAAGSVGIGITNPQQKLDVRNGTILVVNPDASGLRVLSGAATSYTNMTIGRTVGDASISVAAAAGQWANNSSSGDLVIRTETTSTKLLFTNGANNATLVVANNNVGIGITNPNDLLHLSTSESAYIRAERTASGSEGVVIIGASSLGNELYSRSTGTTAKDFRFVIGTAEALRINTSGSVGIGTTNPTAKLEPVDTAANPSVAPVVFIQRPNNVAPASIAPTNADLRIKSHSSNVKIYAEDQNANPLMILTGGGNLGIGTTNPTVALQLSPTASISNVGTGITLPGTVGSALTVAQFFYNNANASYLRIKATRNSTGSDWLSASTKLVQVTDVTEQGYIEFNPNGAIYGMAFGGNNGSGTNVEWARFLPSGNLGIGTTNPDSTLRVEGTGQFVAAASNAATTNAAIYANTPLQTVSAFFGRLTSTAGLTGNQYSTAIRFNGSNIAWGDISYYPNQGGQGHFRFSLASNTVDTTPDAKVGVGELYSAGSVGIGTTNPQNTLHVIGSQRITASSYPAATYGTGLGQIQFGYQDAFDGAELSAGTTLGAGKPLFLNATGSGAVLINSFTSTGTANQRLQVSGGAYVSQNLGVGVTNPASNTQVAIAGTLGISEVGNTGARTLLTSAASGFVLNHNDNSPIIFQTQSTERVRVSVGGSVGIGTNNPLSDLDVFGDISVGDNTTNNGAVYRKNTNAGLILLGGSTGGANIELYGSTHASVADRAYYDALNHNFRNAGSTTTYVAFSTSNSTFNNTVIVANAGIASDGNSQIYLNGATSNRIDFNANGVAAPSTVGTSGTTRSAGTKIVLYPTTTNDYAFGIEGVHQWSSIPAAASGWKWYGGNVGVATLGVAGGLTLSGGLTVGTNSNIVGDFTNATLTARTYFITKTTNSFTVVGAIPNGTSTTSAFYAFNNSTPTNASYCGPVIDSTAAYLRSDRTGTGAYLPLYLQTTDTTRVAITTTGNVGIGITNPGSSLQVAGPSAGVRITNNTGLVGDLSSTGWLISQASSISAIPPASALTISNGSVTALTLDGGNVGINTTDAGAALDVQGNIRIRDTTGSATFTAGGQIAVKDNSSNPFISFHEADGTRNAFIQSTSTGGFFVVQEDALPLVLRTELTSPIQFETASIRRVAISTGGETEFLKGISVVAGIATIPTVSVTATTASTSTTTGALTVAGGVGIAASVHVGGDVDYRRSGTAVLTATYTGTPANIAAISAVGNIGVVTFATTGIAATMNVTGMLPGQVLELFVTNPTTAKVLTIQYNGTAIAGAGIASASPAQGASFAANGTRLYRFIAATNNPAVVAGDIKVVGTT